MDPARDPKAAASAREPVAEPAALPWGMDKTDVQKSSLTALTDEKLARFVIGQQKKTKYEKEREERELKKRKADEEAAAMYAKFVASFEDEDETLGKAFVRSAKGGGSSGDLYRLQASGTKKKLGEMDRLVDEMRQKHEPPPKKRREMDLLVEEIKSRGSSGPLVDELAVAKTGSFDHGDPETTNLYVGNLAPSVTEETLERVFGKFGRINSIKIMWPRSEEERARRRMSGFVSFLTRREADDARVRLHDSELDGQRIVVGWGKAVKIEPNAAAFSAVPATISGPVPASKDPAISPNASANKIVVQIPGDESTRRRIDRLASYVAKDGLAFEEAVRAREAGNPLYAFLSSEGTTDAVYYRWRVFAFAMGDTETAWRDVPFQMAVQGPVWVPPQLPPRPTVSQDSRRDRRQDRSRDRRQDRSRSRSPSRSRSYGGRHSRSPSRSRSRRSRSRTRSRSRSRGHRRRSRSRSYSSGSSSDSDRSRRRRHRRSRSRSRSRSPSRSSRRSHDDRHRDSRRDDRDRDRPSDRDRQRRSRSRSRSRSPTRRRHLHSSGDDSLLKKDESMLTGQQLARARDLERGRERNRLPRDAYEEFMALLDALTLERESIKQAMGCALDNSECAVELVHLMRERFQCDDIDEQGEDGVASPVQLVAYLYVASDILHNSSAAVKNASLFRTTFQECLPEILDALRRAHRRILGRMSALAMRDKVLAVLTAWGSWSLFPPHYLVGLNATFMRKVDEKEYLQGLAQDEAELHGMDEEKLRKACAHAGVLSRGSVREMVARLQWLREFTAPTATAKPVAAKPTVSRVDPPPTTATDIKGGEERQPLRSDQSGEGGETKVKDEEDGGDVDGEPIDPQGDDVDGEPLDPVEEDPEGAEEDLDGAPMDEDEDVDGAPMDEEEDDVDGEPLDEDLDGEPL